MVIPVIQKFHKMMSY